MFSVSGTAQSHQRRVRTHEADTMQLIVKNYTDSLDNSRVRLDSMYAGRSAAGLDGRFNPLFVPMTFYHRVASDMFNIADTTDNLVEQTLLDVYLKRPDLVRNTQSQLNRVGNIIKPHQETVTPDVDIITKVEPTDDKSTPLMPIDIYVERPNFWNFSGDYSLQLFQNYVSKNWYNGGESNYSMLATVTLQANYNNKQRLRWDNKLEMRLGLQNSHGDTLHTVRASEDLLRYTGKLGIQASKKWYYTFQLIASTKFMRGLKSNDKTVYSDFLSPLTINPSLGMNYNVNWFKNKLKGSIHLAPIAYNLTYVKDTDLSTRFGLEPDRHTKSDFGSEVTFDLTWQLAKDVRWKTRLYAYTTYKRMLMEWENTFTFVVNKYISSNVFLYPRFDDGRQRLDGHSYWQLKEYISLGFNYNF